MILHGWSGVIRTPARILGPAIKDDAIAHRVADWNTSVPGRSKASRQRSHFGSRWMREGAARADAELDFTPA